MAWWSQPEALARFVEDLIRAELVRLRPGQDWPAGPWNPTLTWGRGGLGLDSLEMVELSSALIEALHLAAAGFEDALLARPSLAGWLDVCRLSLPLCGDQLVFRTSGSTGRPRSVPHRLDHLLREVEILADLVRPTRILAAVPAHHIYGFLFTILLPDHCACPVLPIPRTVPGALASLLQPGDAVIGHPAYWQGFLRAGGRVGPGVTAITSTAPAPDGVFAALMAAGMARVLELYGSTETAGVGWRTDDGPFTLLPYWSVSPDGDSVISRDPSGAPTSITLPDRLLQRADGRFQVIGRRDDIVQVGGVNVSPQAVRDRLVSHPMIAAAAVRLMRPEEGTRLKAFIVPVPESPVEHVQATLIAWINEHFPAPERPRALTFGAALPMTAMGKAADWPIP